MNYLLDTSACIRLMSEQFARDHAHYRAATARAKIFISTIVLYELRLGVEKSVHVEKNEVRSRRFLHSNINLIDFDSGDAHVAAVIRANLARRKSEIGAYDLLIAAQALNHGLTLITTNQREFSRVDGLLWEDWSQ